MIFDDRFSLSVDTITNDLIRFLMEEKELSLMESLDIVYNSNTFKELNNPNSYLYYESSLNIYNLLNEEILESY